MDLIGRYGQRATFNHCLKSSESRLVALYGRRRVGKTFLIRKHFEGKLLFEVAGLRDGAMEEQLLHFSTAIAKHGLYEAALQSATTWMEAFAQLERLIDNAKGSKKKVLFLDELPWFDTPRSKFLMALESFWNEYCMKRSDVVLVICGSAASWMIKKILKNKGGLHNRVSERMRLMPFDLYETQKFLKAKGIQWSPYDIAQLYMTTGGVPYYLDAVRKGESVYQWIDRVCFDKDGALVGEYDELFHSLFDGSDNHYKIVEILAGKKQGLTRNEIIARSGLASGGTLTKVLDELTESGFIQQVIPYQLNKTKALYKLADSFLIFYHKFMKDVKVSSIPHWVNIVKNQSWISWSGLAFERLCHGHISQIKKALKIDVIQSEVSTWSDSTAQVDMLIDRADRVINLCEIKFYNAEFTIDKDYAAKLRRKQAALMHLKSSKRKNIFITMITTFGAVDNEYHKELIQNEVVLEDLFRGN